MTINYNKFLISEKDTRPKVNYARFLPTPQKPKTSQLTKDKTYGGLIGPSLVSTLKKPTVTQAPTFKGKLTVTQTPRYAGKFTVQNKPTAFPSLKVISAQPKQTIKVKKEFPSLLKKEPSLKVIGQQEKIQATFQKANDEAFELNLSPQKRQNLRIVRDILKFFPTAIYKWYLTEKVALQKRAGFPTEKLSVEEAPKPGSLLSRMTGGGAVTPFFIKTKDDPKLKDIQKEFSDYGEGIKLAEAFGFDPDSKQAKLFGIGFVSLNAIDLFDPVGLKGSAKKALVKGIKEAAETYGGKVVERVVKEVGEKELLKVAKQGSNKVRLFLEDSIIKQGGKPIFKETKELTGEIVEDIIKLRPDQKQYLKDLGTDIQKGISAEVESNKEYLKSLDESIRSRMETKMRAFKVAEQKRELKAKYTKSLQKIDRRRQDIRFIRDYFKLSDTNLKSISRKDVARMSDIEYHNFKKEIENKALKLAERKQTMNELLVHIEEKEFKKIDNYRKVLKLPTMKNMSIGQIKQFDNALSAFQKSDEFLSTRMIEVLNKQNQNIATTREIIENISKKLGISSDKFKIAGRKWTDYILQDAQLIKRNSLYKMTITDTMSEIAIEEKFALQYSRELRDLAKKAKQSRKQGLKEKIGDLFAPQNKRVFEYLESDKTAKDIAELTKDELKFATYIQKRFLDMRDRLIETSSLNKYIDNYIAHRRKSLFENVRDDGALKGLKKWWKQVDDDAMRVTPYDNDGNIMGFETFFKHQLKRTGQLDPSKNIVKVVEDYTNLFHRKQALDRVLPKAVAYSKIMGDESAQKFIKQWLNFKKGIRWDFVKQGGKFDKLLSNLRGFTYLLDLGLNITTGLGSWAGAFSSLIIGSNRKTIQLGLKRRFTKQGKKLIKENSHLFGRNIGEDLLDPSKSVAGKAEDLAMILFRGDRQARINYFLGNLSETEFKTAKISGERMANIKFGWAETMPEQTMQSLLEGSALGKTALMYKSSWAFPLMQTTVFNVAKLKNALKSKEGIKFLRTTKEGQQIVKTSVIGLAVASLYLTGKVDEEDYSFSGRLVNKLLRESASSLSAFNPKTWTSTRLLSLIDDTSEVIMLFVKQEKYKTDSKYGDKGSLKGVGKFKQTFTPKVITQFKKEGGSSGGGASGIPKPPKPPSPPKPPRP